MSNLKLLLANGGVLKKKTVQKILYFAYPSDLEYSGAAVNVGKSEVSNTEGCQ